MATAYTAFPATMNSTDALFRQWTKWIHDGIVLGLVDTLATGSIDFTTVLAPTASGQIRGYKVYSFNDLLQATAPVFVKVNFGSGTAATYPAVQIQVGTTHDGAGNVGGQPLLPQIALNCGNTALSDNYVSAASNRLTFAMFLSSTVANEQFWFGIERTKDATGADTGTGVLLGYGGFSANYSRYSPFTGTVPVALGGMMIVLSVISPSSLSGNVGVSPMIPMGYDAKQPGMNWIVTTVSDFAAYALVPISMYGASRNYQHLGAYPTNMRASAPGTSSGVDPNTRLMMRYD